MVKYKLKTFIQLGMNNESLIEVKNQWMYRVPSKNKLLLSDVLDKLYQEAIRLNTWRRMYNYDSEATCVNTQEVTVQDDNVANEIILHSGYIEEQINELLKLVKVKIPNSLCEEIKQHQIRIGGYGTPPLEEGAYVLVSDFIREKHKNVANFHNILKSMVCRNLNSYAPVFGIFDMLTTLRYENPVENTPTPLVLKFEVSE